MTVALFAHSLRWLVKRPIADGVRRETERHLRAPAAQGTKLKQVRQGKCP